MTRLYGARNSFHFLRLKSTVKLSTKSVESGFVWGNGVHGHEKIWGFYFKDEKAPGDRIFLL